MQPQREANDPELRLRFNSAQRITSATSYVFVVKMENKFKKRTKKKVYRRRFQVLRRQVHRWLSSGTLRRVVRNKVTIVTEVFTGSIIRARGSKQLWKVGHFCQITGCNIAQDSHLHSVLQLQTEILTLDRNVTVPCTDPGANQGVCCRRTATNHLSHVMTNPNLVSSDFVSWVTGEWRC
jgi:hypothetical protein